MFISDFNLLMANITILLEVTSFSIKTQNKKNTSSYTLVTAKFLNTPFYTPGWMQQCSGAGPVPAWSCSSYSRRDSQSGSAHRHGSSDGCGGNGLSGRPFHKGRTCSVSDHGFAYGCARTCSWCKACYRSRICNKDSPA